MHKLSDLFCKIIGAILWALGIMLMIAGKTVLGIILFVLAFIFFPQRTGPIINRLTSSGKRNRNIRTATNLVLIFAIFLVISYTGYNLGTIKSELQDDAYLTDDSNYEDSSTGGKKKSNQGLTINMPSVSGGNLANVDELTQQVNIPEFADKALEFTGIGAAWDNFKKTLTGESKKDGASYKPPVPIPTPKPIKPSEEQPSESTEETTEQPKENEFYINGLEITYIDVGQGDCTLLVSGSEAMLIDAAVKDMGTTINKILMDKGIENLSYMVLTHPDADHIGSAESIINHFDIDYVFMPEVGKDTKTYERTMKAIEYYNVSYCQPSVDSTYSLGECEFTILAPGQKYEDPNNNSICLKVTHGSNSFLFVGDAEAEEDNELLTKDLTATVYKAGHHGSNTSSPKDLISAINPKYCVISCAMNNDYHHPHPSVMRTLKEAGILVYRTDEQGSIVCTSDGSSLFWNAEPSMTYNSGN